MQELVGTSSCWTVLLMNWPTTNIEVFHSLFVHLSHCHCHCYCTMHALNAELYVYLFENYSYAPLQLWHLCDGIPVPRPKQRLKPIAGTQAYSIHKLIEQNWCPGMCTDHRWHCCCWHCFDYTYVYVPRKRKPLWHGSAQNKNWQRGPSLMEHGFMPHGRWQLAGGRRQAAAGRWHVADNIAFVSRTENQNLSPICRVFAWGADASRSLSHFLWHARPITLDKSWAALIIYSLWSVASNLLW